MGRAPYLLAVLAAALSSSSLRAGFNAETGSLVLRTYSLDDYRASHADSPQNWAIAQDRRGIMYFGNTGGVLEFDGVSWRLIRLSNGSVARSLAVDARGTVFAGGQGVFGYLRAGPSGAMEFVSLLDKVPAEDRHFSDLWRILPTAEGVYFSAYERLFRLNPDGTVRVWRPESNFGRAIGVLNGLFVKTREHGLMRMENDRLAPVPGGEIFTKIGVTDAASWGGGALIATPSRLFWLTAEAIRPFPTGADSWFETNVVTTVSFLPGGEIAVGTRRGGLALLDGGGALDRILSSKSDGIPGDYINAIFTDRQGGVWLATYNGLARLNVGLSRFGETSGVQGNIETMARSGGRFFVGSTSGLFRLRAAPAQPPQFEKIGGAMSTVTALLPWGSGVLAAAGNTVIETSGNQAAIVYEGRQLGNDLSASRRDPQAFYLAGREGVKLFRRVGKAWSQVQEYAPPGEEFVSVLEDNDGRVWATTRESIFRIDFRADPVRAEAFGAAQGAPGGWTTARRLGDHVVFATSKGLRRYAENLHRFAPDVSLGTEFADGSRDVVNVFEDRAGNVWITGAGYHDLLLREGGQYRKMPSPLLGSGIDEILWMSLDEDGTAWAVGAKWELYRWERSLAGDPDKGFHAMTRALRNIDAKEAIYAGAGPFAFLRLPWGRNDLHFEFAAPFYEDPSSVEYQWKLEGSDRDWSPWSHDTRKDYTHLPDRDYRFRVRARTPHGAMSEDASVAFGVLPPWYRTWWAYSVYAVLAAFGVLGIVKLRTRQLEEDKRKLEGIVEERTVEVRRQRDEIRVQERKSHSLLLNILPAQVADELKATGAVKPVGFDDVTVCFTDFVGFTLSSEKLAPGSLVDALNEYFTRFDEIVARYGLEKLKTIGDSYMFVSGLPARRASHAVDAVLAALEMVEVVKELGSRPGGTGWNIRVGLHSGPVIAGVVGIRKFAFDIWGNTVNFAARMESSGVPGRVNMSERTCRLTRELVVCEARGQVKIKEGRELPMYLADGPFSADPETFAARYRDEFSEAPTSFPVQAHRESRERSAATVS